MATRLHRDSHSSILKENGDARKISRFKELELELELEVLLSRVRVKLQWCNVEATVSL